VIRISNYEIAGTSPLILAESNGRKVALLNVWSRPRSRADCGGQGTNGLRQFPFSRVTMRKSSKIAAISLERA